VPHHLRAIGALAALLFLAVSRAAFAADDNSPRETLRAALEVASFIVGPSVNTLPIALASVAPKAASRGIEAWTEHEGDAPPRRIFICTESATFRCAASVHDSDRSACLLKLASIIVHEAWHFSHGNDEAGAYQAQITFLILSGGSSPFVAGVRRARDRVLASQRAAQVLMAHRD